MTGLSFLYQIISIVWIFVAARQFKSEDFFYFLFMAMIELTTYFVRNILHSNSNSFAISFSLLILFSLYNKNIFIKYIYLFGVIFIIASCIDWNALTHEKQIYLMAAFQFLFFVIFLKRFIISTILEKKINFFLLLLMFYELTILSKLITLISGSASAYMFFIITTMFEGIIGFIFLYFREDDHRLIMNIS
jgi:hypothetical protein